MSTKARMTPPLSVRGRFTFKAPFAVQPTNVYEVIALRYFEDIVAEGEDVFAEYYQAPGLTTADYNEDRQLGAVIVTLQDPHGNILYIPDTYIASYPNQSQFEYHHIVLSVSLGSLPSTVDLTFAKDEVKGVVDKILGISSVVYAASAPKQGTVTPEQHESNEAARAAAIQMNESVYARNIRLEAALAQSQETIAALTQALENAGLIGP